MGIDDSFRRALSHSIRGNRQTDPPDSDRVGSKDQRIPCAARRLQEVPKSMVYHPLKRRPAETSIAKMYRALRR